jgi:hypothetical protein
MKIKNQWRFALLVFFASTTALTVNAQRPPMPDGLTVCHVVTENGLNGIVLAQTADRELAALGASTSKAWEVSGGRAGVDRVIECAVQPDGTLADKDVQRFFEEMVR